MLDMAGFAGPKLLEARPLGKDVPPSSPGMSVWIRRNDGGIATLDAQLESPTPDQEK
jgi:hypothetical protein